MRNVSDEDIKAQAKQPDIGYMSAFNLVGVAHSLSYNYDDYVALAKEAGRFVYGQDAYASYLKYQEGYEASIG